MADRPAPITQLAYEGFRTELIARINARRALFGLGPIAEDYAANPHMIFVEGLSLYAEMTGNTIDNRKLAAVLVLARNLEDATFAAESIGYDWQGVSPATASLNLDFGVGGWAEDVVFERGHLFLEDPHWVVGEETTVLAGTQFATLQIRQVRIRRNEFTSNGQQAQTFELPNSPVVKDSFFADVDGTPYTVVDDAFILTPADEGLEVRVDYRERGIVKTGNGTNGVIIGIGNIIGIDYETSLGSGGRIGAGVISKSVTPILDVLSNPVAVTITQPVGSSGGEDRESLESMKFNGPRSLRTLQASISRSDFETNALQVDGVLRALPLTYNEDAAIPPNVTLILIAAEPPGVGEAVIFNDPHDDDNYTDSWIVASGSWVETGGELQGNTTGGVINMLSRDFYWPVETRANAYAAAINEEVGLLLRRSSTPADYLYARLEYDGANTQVRVGQRLSAVESEATATISHDLTTLDDITIHYSLNDELQLFVAGSLAASFTPDVAFRDEKLLPAYEGRIRVNDTSFVSLTDLPIPNQALLQDVADYIANDRPTLVSHNVQTGEIRAKTLNLELELTPLAGFSLAQSRANVSEALANYLSITRRNQVGVLAEETGDFANQPGVTISLDDLYAALRTAAGVARVRILWPAAFDIIPQADELIIFGEIKWA